MSVPDAPRIVVVAGPTASGKTAVGIALGLEFRGEIVSADSIQVYRYMDVGSAKPTREERSRVPHHLLDIRDPDEDFSAGDFVKEARTNIGEILSRGNLPLVVGGTGLYIRALLRGIADLPPSDASLRGELRSEEARLGSGTLFQRLTRVDPDSAAGIDPHNLPRIVRALEVWELTGRKPSEIRRAHSFGERPYRFLLLCLAQERSILYERIDNRVECMIREGLLDEVTRLSQMGYTRNLKSLQSIGYRHAGMILAGEVELLEGITLMKRDTRHFAKRQLTWFRSEPEVVWCDPHDLDGIRSVVRKFVER
ncbi:MAG: tRNA (adenosine(37)-N6)-dimethylallyltransferase MiaA [Thermodesulfobacteriota bacterium]